MARKPRVEFPGALYHVISRGNRREKIFHDDEDRLHYLDRLERYRARHAFHLYAYVLMSNHVHLLLETGKVALSMTMQGLQFTYTQYYNRKYGKVGHLFQGRYRAILCEREAYLLELVRYIHLNPARMRVPEDPFRYRWSSHGAYVGGEPPVRVETAVILGQFHPLMAPARRAYMEFMRGGLEKGHQERYYETVDQRFLGSGKYVEELARKARADREIEVGMRKVGWERLVGAVSQAWGVGVSELVGRERGDDVARARAMLVYLGRAWGRMRVRELARRLGRGSSMVSRLYGRYEMDRDLSMEKRLASALS